MNWILLILMITGVAHAGVTPTAQPFDTRITQAKYNSEDVIRVRAKIGITTLIQLEPGENILVPSSGMSIGDDEAWTIGVKENNIFLKPKANNFQTNLTLVSSKGRTYSFQLIESRYPHYIVKMAYEKPPSKEHKMNVPCFQAQANFNYEKWGDESLAPDYMWDDGHFTCLKFTQAKELPVAYKVSEGRESLINYHIEKDTMVLQNISKEFRLRLGDQVLGLRSGTPKKAASKARRILK